MLITTFRKIAIEMLILHLLQEGEMYGYQLAQEMRKRSTNLLLISESLLYPTLYSLIDRKIISVREEIVGKRLRKYYKLEDAGNRYLKIITAEYISFNRGVKKIMQS